MYRWAMAGKRLGRSSLVGIMPPGWLPLLLVVFAVTLAACSGSSGGNDANGSVGGERGEGAVAMVPAEDPELWVPAPEWPTPRPGDLGSEWPTPPPVFENVPEDYEGLCQAVSVMGPIWEENVFASTEIPDPRELPDGAPPIARRHPILEYATPFDRQFTRTINAFVEGSAEELGFSAAVGEKDEVYREDLYQAVMSLRLLSGGETEYVVTMVEAVLARSSELGSEDREMVEAITKDLTRCWPPSGG